MFGYYLLDKSAACVLLKVAAVDGEIAVKELIFIKRLFEKNPLYKDLFYKEALMMDLNEAMVHLKQLNQSLKLELAMEMISLTQADGQTDKRQLILVDFILNELAVLDLINEMMNHQEKLNRLGFK